MPEIHFTHATTGASFVVPYPEGQSPDPIVASYEADGWVVGEPVDRPSPGPGLLNSPAEPVTESATSQDLTTNQKEI